jgi:transcriptional regulator with XRE-family HTH domain
MCDKLSVDLERLKELIDNSGVSRQVIADKIGCDVSTITKQYNGDRNITVDYVIKYAKYFNVSTDYLLGLSTAPTTDKDIKFICDYTNLNEDSVNTLHGVLSRLHGLDIPKFINFLLEIGIFELADLYMHLYCFKDYKRILNDLKIEFLSKQKTMNFDEFETFCDDYNSRKDKILLSKYKAQSCFNDIINLFAEEDTADEKIDEQFKEAFKNKKNDYYEYLASIIRKERESNANNTQT